MSVVWTGHEMAAEQDRRNKEERRMINGHTINYYTTRQAAEILGMTGSNVLLLLKSGALKDMTGPGMHKRVDAASVHALADQRRQRRERLIAKKEAALRRKQAQAERSRASLPALSSTDALLQQQVTQLQQVVNLLGTLVGAWCGARQ